MDNSAALFGDSLDIAAPLQQQLRNLPAAAIGCNMQQRASRVVHSCHIISRLHSQLLCQQQPRPVEMSVTLATWFI